MRVIVLGDRITDQYRFCKSVGICPEAPIAKAVIEEQRTNPGGAALVTEQLKILLGDTSVVGYYGSMSTKERTFVDGHIMSPRIDIDSQSVLDAVAYWNQIKHSIDRATTDAIIVGDYGKGAMKNVAIRLTEYCSKQSIPLFVDAKHDPTPYKGCFAIFPNELEHNGLSTSDYQHVVRKLGPRGCSVDGHLVSTEVQQVFDVTGAGDIFMAAFVYKWLSVVDSNLAKNTPLFRCLQAAKYANKVAGISVRHLGTYVVSLVDINR